MQIHCILFSHFLKKISPDPEAISDLGVSRRDPLILSTVLFIWMRTMCPDAVDTSRNDETEELFACPQWLRFEDGGLWHFTVPGREMHHQVHHLILYTVEGSTGKYWMCTITAK